MSNSPLEERIQRLADLDAIRSLKHRYMAFADANYDADGLRTLMVPDAVWDGGDAFGRHEGADAFVAMVREVSKSIVFAAHLAMNEIIEIDGDRATGQWWLLMPCTIATQGGKDARWIIARYDDVYVRVNGTWLFQSTLFDVKVFAAHSQGWVKD